VGSDRVQLICLRRMNERLKTLLGFPKNRRVTMNDLSVIFSREETDGRVRVTVAEERVKRESD